jgi:hypothetical protein
MIYFDTTKNRPAWSALGPRSRKREAPGVARPAAKEIVWDDGTRDSPDEESGHRSSRRHLSHERAFLRARATRLHGVHRFEGVSTGGDLPRRDSRSSIRILRGPERRSSPGIHEAAGEFSIAYGRFRRRAALTCSGFGRGREL